MRDLELPKPCRSVLDSRDNIRSDNSSDLISFSKIQSIVLRPRDQAQDEELQGLRRRRPGFSGLRPVSPLCSV